MVTACSKPWRYSSISGVGVGWRRSPWWKVSDLQLDLPFEGWLISTNKMVALSNSSRETRYFQVTDNKNFAFSWTVWCLFLLDDWIHFDWNHQESTRDSIISVDFAESLRKPSQRARRKQTQTQSLSWFFRFFFQERLRLHQRSVRKVHGWQVPRGDVVPSQPVSAVSVLGKPRAPKGIQFSNGVSMSGRISFCVSQ